MKLGCTDDKLEVELKSNDEKPFIVEADVANSSAPAEAPKQKWVVFKSKTSNTPDENEFNSSSNPITECADLNRNNICDDKESKPVYADPCRGRFKCEYVEADVVGDAVAPETRDPSNSTSTPSDVVSALKEAEAQIKVLNKDDIKKDIAKAESKMEAKAESKMAKSGCEGDVCADLGNGNKTSSGNVLSKAELKADIAKAETKMEKKAENGTSKSVSSAIEAALKEADASASLSASSGSGSSSTPKSVKAALASAERQAEFLNQQSSDSSSSSKKSVKAAIASAERQEEALSKQSSDSSSSSKKSVKDAIASAERQAEFLNKQSSSRSETTGQAAKDLMAKDFQEDRSFNGTSNSTDVSSVVAKIEKIKAKEDKKILKAKAKINAQGALLNATIAKEDNIAEQIEQLSTRISSIESNLAGSGSQSPKGLIAEAVKKVKAYFRKALKSD